LTTNDSLEKSRDILWTHLRALPAFRALIRAIEHRLLVDLGPLPEPLLDIGCGDGHFAEVTIKHAAVGVDIAHPSLVEAKGRGVYGALDVASARNIPYRSDSFGAVLANCAVEHMPRLDQVFGEVARVLKPGGKFILSVPTDQLNRNLWVAGVLDRAGAHGLAERYRHWFKRIQVHFHMYSPDEWQRRLEAHGLKVTYRRGYLSPRATQYLELGHYYGLPSLIGRRLFGTWVVWPWRPRFVLEEAVLAPRVAEDGVPNSGCCLFVAEKI
jgi:ubiquinone/menaquinone biosynthesis C-methylase UbiE